mgnify:CR=1 FL=1
MKSEGLINISQAVAHGNLRWVKNCKTEKQGIVINVEGKELTVNIGSETEVWSFKDCAEITWQ